MPRKPKNPGIRFGYNQYLNEKRMETPWGSSRPPVLCRLCYNQYLNEKRMETLSHISGSLGQLRILLQSIPQWKEDGNFATLTSIAPCWFTRYNQYLNEKRMETRNGSVLRVLTAGSPVTINTSMKRGWKQPGLKCRHPRPRMKVVCYNQYLNEKRMETLPQRLQRPLLLGYKLQSIPQWKEDGNGDGSSPLAPRRPEAVTINTSMKRGCRLEYANNEFRSDPSMKKNNSSAMSNVTRVV